MNAKNAARDIVERARAGDQVAMGIIVQVRKNAELRIPRAVAARRAIISYIKRNPPGSFGTDNTGRPSDLVMNTKAMKALWTVPQKNFVPTFAKSAPFVSLWQGVVCILHRGDLRKGSPLVMVTNAKDSRIAEIVKKAILIKRLRNPAVPLTTYCPATGWEHGE